MRDLQRTLAGALLAIISVAPAAAAVTTRPTGGAPALEQRVAVELPPLSAGVRAFADAAKEATPWRSASTMKVDRLGYPTALAHSQTSESVIFTAGSHPAGDYVVLYRGEGALEAIGGTTLQRAPGRFVVRLTSNDALTLRLSATTPSNYVRDVHVVPVDAEQTFASSPFLPQFVQTLRGARILQFGTWMYGETNAAPAVTPTRPTTGAYTTAVGAGAAPEYLVALSNEVGADPWFTLPVGATDGYVRAFAQIVREQLDPRLHPIFEYGDRVWLAGTPANGWALMAGRTLRTGTSPRNASLLWYGQRSAKIFTIVRASFGADAARVVTAIGGPTDNAAELRTILSAAGASRQGDAIVVTGTVTPAAANLIAAAHLATLHAGDVHSAIADAALHRAAPLEPDARRIFVATPDDDEVIDRADTPRSHAAPVLARPHAGAALAAHGATMTVQLGEPLRSTDLSREGTEDWVHWGLTGQTADRRASSSTRISDVAITGRNGVARFDRTFASYTWIDGHPRTSIARTQTGIALTGAGSAFALSAPADTQLRTLRVYVGVERAAGTFTATLSDGSAPAYSDAQLERVTGSVNGVYTVVYRASRPGEHLNVTFGAAKLHGNGRVILEAATLQRHAPAPTVADVATFHNDNARTGWNPTESILTPANVGSSSFGLLKTLAVDGSVLAQPLYLGAQVMRGQGTHNILLVATEHDTLYEYDADTFALLNKRTFGPSQASTDVGCEDIRPEYGITSTPVVDRSTNTIYVVAATEPHRNTFVATLHAVDINTLADKRKATKIDASVKMSNGQTITFDSQNQYSRTSLAFANGQIYVGLGSHCDNNPGNIVGWMLSYDQTLKQIGSFATAEDTTPYLLSSIWMTGFASAIDDAGNVYSVIGNGAFDADQSGGKDYGESTIKLDPALKGVQTFFTPKAWKHLNRLDLDFGSGGILLLPQQQGATPNLAVAMGKTSILYLLNRDNLGGVANPLQNIKTQGQGVWGGPAFFDGPNGQFIYYQGGDDVLRAYKVHTNANGATRVQQTSIGTSTAGYGGSSPIVSSNGQTPGTGIVWLVERDHTLRLEAYDAANVHSLLFSGAAGVWKNKENNGFVTALEANGKVYVPAQGTVTIFGLKGSNAFQSPGSVAPPASPANDGLAEMSGRIVSAAGNTLVLRLHDGSTANLDIAHARATHHTGVLAVGAAVVVYGKRGTDGRFHATSVGHSNPGTP